jgi:DNA-binding transcriptional LysR family regulator
MVQISDMAVFVRVVERGSMSRAGRELRLTPPAVTKRISKLEDRLGVRLLNRTTRRVQVTEDGARYYEDCARILADIDAAESALTLARGMPHGLLRISLPTLFGRLRVAPLIPEFIARNPSVQVHMHLSDQFVKLPGDGYDLAIRNTELDDTSLVARKLAPDRRVICGTPEYFEAHGRPSHPDELLDHACLLLRYPGTKQYRWYFRGVDGAQIPVPVKGPMDADSTDVLHQWTLAGHGLSLRSTSEVGEDLRAGRLETVLEEFMPAGRFYYAVYPHRQVVETKVNAFVSFLAESFGPEPEWDSGLKLARS